MRKYLMLNGSNMNLLGMREPVYGTVTMVEVEERLTKLAKEYGVEVEFFQSNHEGEIVDKLQELRGKVDGIFFNPAAFTFYSYAIRDAITACNHRVIEVHISNVLGQIVGLGVKGYEIAFRYLVETDIERDNEKNNIFN